MAGTSASDKVEYWLILELPGRVCEDPIRFLADRALTLGDVLTLPMRPSGELYPAEAYDWEVIQVRQEGSPPHETLVVAPPQPA
jgi:hypothetical protein